MLAVFVVKRLYEPVARRGVVLIVSTSQLKLKKYVLSSSRATRAFIIAVIIIMMMMMMMMMMIIIIIIIRNLSFCLLLNISLTAFEIFASSTSAMVSKDHFELP